MFISVNLSGDVEQDRQRDGGHGDVDETQVGRVAEEAIEEPGERVQDPVRDDVQAGKGRDLRIPLWPKQNNSNLMEPQQ